MSKLHGRDLLEEMQWKYANGPLPTHRRRKVQQRAALGCLLRTAYVLALVVAILLLVRWIL